MSDRSLFTQRVRVGIADSAQPAFADSNASSTLMALAGYSDVSEKTKHIIWKAFEFEPVFLQTAFWESFKDELSLPQSKSRLYVNPPSGLPCREDQPWTFSYHGSLDGSYGLPLGSSNLVNIEGTHDGYFDDIVVFADVDISDALKIIEKIIPSSTVTLCRPIPHLHSFWLGWSGIRIDFPNFMGVLSKNFKPKILDTTQTANISVTVLGIEAL